tara:strand:- start:35664 stop:36434 length:771 start_codon:yes stop_codon:yes gene_type:complete
MDLEILGSNAALNNPQVIFLDKDGTIIDGHYYWIKMIELRSEIILKNLKRKNDKDLKKYLENTLGVDHRLNRLKPNGPVGIKPKKFNITHLKEELVKVDVDLSREEITKVFDTADKISLDSISSFLRVLPGVRHFLKECRENGIDLILISNDQSKRANLALKSLELDSLFEFVYGADSVNNPKPAKDLAMLAIKEGNYDPTKVINIGDHPNDIIMGERAGLGLNIGISTGVTSKEEFNKLNCSKIDSFKELRISND